MYFIVPLILRDALQVTSQACDEEMAKTLKLAYELTGNNNLDKYFLGFLCHFESIIAVAIVGQPLFSSA